MALSLFVALALSLAPSPVTLRGQPALGSIYARRPGLFMAISDAEAKRMKAKILSLTEEIKILKKSAVKARGFDAQKKTIEKYKLDTVRLNSDLKELRAAKNAAVNGERAAKAACTSAEKALAVATRPDSEIVAEIKAENAEVAAKANARISDMEKARSAAYAARSEARAALEKAKQGEMEAQGATAQAKLQVTTLEAQLGVLRSELDSAKSLAEGCMAEVAALTKEKVEESDTPRLIRWWKKLRRK